MTDETISGIVNDSQQTPDAGTAGNVEAKNGVFSKEIDTKLAESSKNASDWYISDGVKGAGDAPDGFDTDKHKNLFEAFSTQKKSIEDMRKMVSKLPAEIESYSISNIDSLKDIGLDEDSEKLSEFKNLAKEQRISQKTFDTILDFYAKTSKNSVESNNLDIKAYEQQEFEKLGDNGKEKVNTLVNWANNTLPEDVYESFKKTMTSADSVNVLNYFRENMINNNNIPSSSRSASSSERSSSLIQKTREAMAGKFNMNDLKSDYESLYGK